ncbi:hypothetical protein OG555_34130 [Kribbella sp. NBC_01484]|uniref:hypothetical protein n=1 Tax=Kribbella sp. NBC_01484 TaxID=2903579 RepID=UPI002E2ED17F|nr:hypothetical protein [Kribbella sp. NBC_01484]
MGPAPADAGLHTAGGRLVRVDDESGTTVFDYDERGQVATKKMTRADFAPLTLETVYRARTGSSRRSPTPTGRPSITSTTASAGSWRSPTS